MRNRTVWAVLQQRDGKLHRGSWEAIAAAQEIARLTGGGAEGVLLGCGLSEAAEQVAACDLAAVRVADHPELAAYTPGGYVGALAPAVRAAAPAFVIFPHTYQSVEYVPRLAQTLGAGLIPEAIAVRAGESGLLWKRPVLGGKLHAEVRPRGEGTFLVSVQSGAFGVDVVRPGRAPLLPFPLDAGALKADREILRVEQVAGERVDLSQAAIIVAVGRGIGGADKIAIVEDLARELGAEIGASRPVIDNDWLPRDRQIGSSGQTVAPKLYLAVGISGAIQHLVGMKGAQVVAAINKDPSAPIFSIAHYGIVGDLHEVVPALTAAVREARGG